MRLLAAAIVTVAMIGANLASDIWITNAETRDGWNVCTALVLGAFLALCVIDARNANRKSTFTKRGDHQP